MISDELRVKLRDSKEIVKFYDYDCLVNNVLNSNNISLVDYDCGLNGWNLLHYAARYNLVDIAKLLLENEINFKLKDFQGRTPLMIGVAWNNVSVVKLLLLYDDLIDFDDVYEKTGILRNETKEYSEIINFLKEAECNFSLSEEFSRALNL